MTRRDADTATNKSGRRKRTCTQRPLDKHQSWFRNEKHRTIYLLSFSRCAENVNFFLRFHRLYDNDMVMAKMGERKTVWPVCNDKVYYVILHIVSNVDIRSICSKFCIRESVTPYPSPYHVTWVSLCVTTMLASTPSIHGFSDNLIHLIQKNGITSVVGHFVTFGLHIVARARSCVRSLWLDHWKWVCFGIRIILRWNCVPFSGRSVRRMLVVHG